MLPSAQTPAVNWQNLLRSVDNNECILVLGPETAAIERDGHRVSLPTLLALHLADAVRARNPQAALVDDTNPAYVAKTLEDAIFAQEVAKNPNYSRENARDALAGIINDFYAQYSFRDFPVYAQLAKMSFHFIVETNPAPFLAQALDDENKFGAKCEYYHYANPSHNNSIKIQENEIRPDAPLVYHLFGATEQPASMVVTERDQLAFLDAVLQKENTASIPSSVAIHFTSGKERQQFDKTFVFLGFDFNQWHLRLILHLIGRYQRQKETYALQNPGNLHDLTAFFYRNNFDVRFVDTPAERFLADFDHALQQPRTPKAQQSSQLKVFLMYDPADEAEKNALDTQLNPLRRTEFIQTWDESQMLAGAEREREIAGRIAEADIILLLITANFFHSDDIYDKYLRAALQRHHSKQSVVIPLLIKSCLWEDTPIGKLTTILPRNKTAIDTQSSDLSDTIEQLHGWCKKIVDRKKAAR
ncbi:MAG: toll/interleukin-1 receptor domain-containing protein [Saprospiraceae bacterium]|nr:toll/interleukin-1 receptor domain-containing protein [Saprospiraceae bacterium]